MEHKKVLRRQMKALLHAHAEHSDPSAADFADVFKNQAALFDSCTKILGYLPIHGEPDLRPFFKSFQEKGIEIYLPRIESDTMLFYRVHSLDGPWERHRWGMEEPARSKEFFRPESGGAQTLILIPGLAFARDGHRLGRGGGFYDRFLESLPPETRKIGVCWEFQIVESVPLQAHDVRLDGLITETTFLSRQG